MAWLEIELEEVITDMDCSNFTSDVEGTEESRDEASEDPDGG